jgi:hypothetical protein
MIHSPKFTVVIDACVLYSLMFRGWIQNDNFQNNHFSDVRKMLKRLAEC